MADKEEKVNNQENVDNQEATDKEKTPEKEMSFLDRLEELRWHLIRSLSSILVFAIAAFVSKKIIFHGINTKIIHTQLDLVQEI